MAHSKPERTSAKLSAYQECKKWNRTFSSAVCFLLDNLGYSDDMRKFRECAHNTKANDMSRNFTYHVTILATGSKGEGASLPLQGDNDHMYVTDDILCVENTSGSSDFYILKAERNDSVPPGYTRVVAVNHVHTEAPPWFWLVCSRSVVYLTQNGLPYLSSAVFNNICRKTQSFFNLSSYYLLNDGQVSYSGPATNKKSFSSINIAGTNFSGLVLDEDSVYGIYFYSSQYTSKLASRLGHCDWFSPSLIDCICSTEGFILPVGSIEGENPDLEWRISYVKTENKMICNLNTTQFKLYVIMKMIAKELIYPDLPVISSYVVKNVVLWVCELNTQVSDPHSRVGELTSRPDKLLDLIVQCLSFMRTCVINNHLPNYVIPERNLIASRLTLQSKQQLVDHLEKLLNEGRNIFCRLNIFIKHSPLSLVLTPCSVFFYGRRRDEIEKLFLQKQILEQKQYKFDQYCRSTMVLENFMKNLSDKRYLAITLKLMKLLVPEWKTLKVSRQFKVFFELCKARLQQYLS